MKPECDILSALREAHLIASKLRLTEFDTWIQLELKGYVSYQEEDVPDYRNVKGRLKAFNPYKGWIPVQYSNNELEKRYVRKNCGSQLVNCRNCIIKVPEGR